MADDQKNMTDTDNSRLQETDSESQSDLSDTEYGTTQALVNSDLDIILVSEQKISEPILKESDSESQSDLSNTEHALVQNEVSDLFPPTDIILEVEGTDIHLNKQVLMDNSDVFRAMFENEFREKYKERIPLSGKNYEDFVEFLHTFYPVSSCASPGAPITEETILEITPLADEYKVDSVQRKCESFLQEVCQKVCDDKYSTIETSKLVNYVACAERYRMTSVLPLAIRLCAERSARLLEEVGLHSMISQETAKQIFESRDKRTEEEVKLCLSKGYLHVSNTMKLYWESFSNDEQKKYERILVDACKRASRKSKSMVSSITVNELLDIIISAERYQLQNLLSAAVTLASKCGFEYISESKNYGTISSATKLRICLERLDIVDKPLFGFHRTGTSIQIDEAYRCPK